LVQLRTQLVVRTVDDLLPFDAFQTGGHCVCANGVQSAAKLYGTQMPPIVRVKLACVCARDVHHVAFETEGPLVGVAAWVHGRVVADGDAGQVGGGWVVECGGMEGVVFLKTRGSRGVSYTPKLHPVRTKHNRWHLPRPRCDSCSAESNPASLAAAMNDDHHPTYIHSYVVHVALHLADRRVGSISF
jgi:hypothetical protein